MDTLVEMEAFVFPFLFIYEEALQLDVIVRLFTSDAPKVKLIHPYINIVLSG